MTTSRNPALRLLLIGLAILILNLYLARRQVFLTLRRFGSRMRQIWLTLKRLALILVRLIEHSYGIAVLDQVTCTKLIS